MKANLQIKLFDSKTAMTNGKVLVNEFDSEDLPGVDEWTSFLDASEVSLHAHVKGGGVQMAAHHAYAPCPMVFETIRKGSSLGRGASCE